MRKLFLFTIGLFVFSGCTKPKLILDSSQITIETTNRLNQVQFVNSQIGFVVGGIQFSTPTMFKTLDGGFTWKEVNLPDSNERKEIYSIAVLPNGNIITVGYGGTMFISQDTGRSFKYVQHSSWKALKDVCYRTNSQGLIVGGEGFNIGHISEFNADGIGLNSIKEEMNFELTDIDFIDSMNGYISGYGAILKTTDGGLNWDFTAANNDYFKAMVWKNVNEGVAVGYEGSILKTNDGGASWQIKRNGNDISKQKIHFLNIARNDASTIIAIGEKGACFMSKDDGDTWVQTNQISMHELRGITFRDDVTCFICGEDGKFFEVRL